MRSRATTAVLTSLLLFALSGPILAVSSACDEVDCGEACGLECAACLCCLHAPRTAVLSQGWTVLSPQPSVLAAERPASPCGPFQPPILHVPIATASR